MASVLFTLGCGKGGLQKGLASQPDSGADQKDSTQGRPESAAGRVKITAGGRVFYATLENNATAKAIVKKLPLSVTMTELNSNEKFYRFSQPFPSADKNPGQIHTGDLMLYDGEFLVLFYKDFSTSYRYTKVGHMDKTDGLADALGNGNAAVTFEQL